MRVYTQAHLLKDYYIYLSVLHPFYERENGNVILRQRATKQTGNQFLSSEPNTEDASNSYAWVGMIKHNSIFSSPLALLTNKDTGSFWQNNTKKCEEVINQVTCENWLIGFHVAIRHLTVFYPGELPTFPLYFLTNFMASWLSYFSHLRTGKLLKWHFTYLHCIRLPYHEISWCLCWVVYPS